MAPHEAELIGTLAVGLTAAFIGGLIAHRLRLPAIVGYLLAGVVVGPFTPGFVADARLAPQLAELGVIFLMFGVGIHFSLTDLMAVRRIAAPAALAGIAATTLLGFGLTRFWGWNAAAGVVFGLALSVASTVVALRTLGERGLLESSAGRIAVGWLVVEDAAMVFALVLLPTVVGAVGGAVGGAAPPNLPLTLATTLGKEAVFIALMIVAGARFIPWLLRRVERTGSRELFVLATLATALFIAYGATQWFGVSSALGAFLAGIVINESDLSARAAAEALPLRDVFAVLFFVSVGMAIDPRFLANEIGRVAAVVAIIVIGKAIAATIASRLPGGDRRIGLTLAAALAQIGEFSFILAGSAAALGILTADAVNLILAGSLCSITLNPALFRLIEPLAAWCDQRRPAPVGASLDGSG